MKDTVIEDVASRAGIMVDWSDHAGKPHRVAIQSLRTILAALGLPCETPGDVAESQRILGNRARPAMITATVGAPVSLAFFGEGAPSRALLCEEKGTKRDLDIGLSHCRRELPPINTPGYHRLEFGNDCVSIAVAPPRCPGVREIAETDKVYGLAAQIYALRRAGDCGIGDTGSVIELATEAAALGADMLALSPVHALFGADPGHFSPYSPSSRLFLNPLHADPRVLFGEERVKQALSRTNAAADLAQLEHEDLIDWPRSTQLKMTLFREIFEDFCLHDLAGGSSSLAADFEKFRAAGGRLLANHAVFETLHAYQVGKNPAAWHWTQWPQPLRDPSRDGVRSFALTRQKEVTFQCFLQWLADRSLSAAQENAKKAGMRIGLVADLAIGMSGGGSHAWTSQGDILTGLEIGAPPDLYNATGQNWGLTTFSPRSLAANGFSPFIATLRAGLRHAGGLRVDHAMGFMRLWVIPHGADPSAGAYLSYPMNDLLRLTTLEAYRHRSIIIGEDLGTVPTGFHDLLAEVGIYGMRVLWFERKGGSFMPPQTWDVAAAAMTSTHDLPTVAGWWSGADIDMRALSGFTDSVEAARQTRAKERRLLWRAFRRTRAAEGKQPGKEGAGRAVDAAVEFISKSRSDIALLPIEDALAIEEQPNVPGTTDEFPNWRRRYPGCASELLRAPEVKQRLGSLAQRGRR
jgi:4-alpha-glucanotransferase